MGDAVTPFVLKLPRNTALPILFDSPHSGRHYPSDWETNLSLAELRRIVADIRGAISTSIATSTTSIPSCSPNLGLGRTRFDQRKRAGRDSG